MKIVEGQDHSKIGVQSQDYFKVRTRRINVQQCSSKDHE